MNISSICIPSIEKHITKEKIKKIFGKIGTVDYVEIKYNNKFSSAFIYMKNWYLTNIKVNNLYEKISSGEEINLIYDFPWFWKCRANYNIKELKFYKLEDEMKEKNTKIDFLRSENWKLKSYLRWINNNSV